MDQHLDLTFIAVIAGSFVVWSAFSAQLQRWNISGPIFFVAVGVIFTTGPLAILKVPVHSSTVRLLLELALALTLFSDASRINSRAFKVETGLAVRLLFIGLPLTIAFGIGIGWLLFSSVGIWVVATIAAAVAPTDAALGAAVMEDERIALGVRDLLNVESGLNDGIATPFVTCFVAAAVTELGSNAFPVRSAVRELAIGIVIGALIGFVGGKLLKVTLEHEWGEPAWGQVAVLALALASYSLGIGLGGNGFIAAFVGGLCFALAKPPQQAFEVAFANRTGGVLAMLGWFLFGAAILVQTLKTATWREAVFALCALTILRMVPVAICLLGTGLKWSTVLFLGWFGPRGLASIVFGLIAFDAFSGVASTDVLSAVTLTIVGSVILHGISAGPLATAFAKRASQDWLSAKEPTPRGA